MGSMLSMFSDVSSYWRHLSADPYISHTIVHTHQSGHWQTVMAVARQFLCRNFRDEAGTSSVWHFLLSTRPASVSLLSILCLS